MRHVSCTAVVWAVGGGLHRCPLRRHGCVAAVRMPVLVGGPATVRTSRRRIDRCPCWVPLPLFQPLHKGACGRVCPMYADASVGLRCVWVVGRGASRVVSDGRSCPDLPAVLAGETHALGAAVLFAGLCDAAVVGHPDRLQGAACTGGLAVQLTVVACCVCGGGEADGAFPHTQLRAHPLRGPLWAPLCVHSCVCMCVCVCLVLPLHLLPCGVPPAQTCCCPSDPSPGACCGPPAPPHWACLWPCQTRPPGPRHTHPCPMHAAGSLTWQPRWRRGPRWRAAHWWGPAAWACPC